MALLHDTSPQQRLWDMIRDIRFGMMTTRHHDGQLRSRPMTTQNRSVDEGGVLWFFVSRSSEAGMDLHDDGAVNIAYADPDKDRYISLAGFARFVDNPDKKNELWNSATQAWFPNGPDDPDVGLLAVHVDHAEYWDVEASKMVQLFKMARAAVTGERPRDMGDHREVRL
ncbi:pyridoxamine 5'-phosphate oxidase family protein [Aquabacterium sp. A7-Y]|uniref:pyridoxamine 5'-phosphate oxidase family protein n=1 Tax=Aquabacterium sp. A7-Y TaxID=1349605 RepID=UPI00223CE0DD|nr:pyridoxamine 5'-phosphate oxidase family protein [Aquabacterium sp. A7-Y]MCW7539619.1 pyridoxamine 5'-phosphate oxidase family protein [Aquabacterium sp. A7-Y]